MCQFVVIWARFLFQHIPVCYELPLVAWFLTGVTILFQFSQYSYCAHAFTLVTRLINNRCPMSTFPSCKALVLSMSGLMLKSMKCSYLPHQSTCLSWPWPCTHWLNITNMCDLGCVTSSKAWHYKSNLINTIRLYKKLLSASRSFTCVPTKVVFQCVPDQLCYSMGSVMIKK